MHTFVVIDVPDFTPPQRVKKLVRNGKCLYDEFLEDIKKDNNLKPELGDLTAIIKYVADGKTPLPPKSKYRCLKLGSNLKYTAYEAKSDHLRLYLFHENGTGQILVFGGKKTKQDSTDLPRLKKIIKEYTEFQRLKPK